MLNAYLCPCPLLQLSQGLARSQEGQQGMGVRYASRAVLLLTEYLRAVGQHSEANWAFMKAHFQVGGGGGVGWRSECV